MIRANIRKIFANIPILDGYFRRIIWSRIHFPEQELQTLHDTDGRPIDVAIDVGAALGSYSWVLGRKSKKVFAFEPGNKHFKNLNIATSFSCIEALNSAVGKHSGSSQLFTPYDTNDGRHMATLSENNPIIRSSDTTTTTVQVISLDEFAFENLEEDERVDLIKIDVEGYENEVLVGAEKIIKKHFPVVIIEIEARHNSKFDFAFTLLQGLGYKVYAYQSGAYAPITIEEVAAQKIPDFLRNDQNRNQSSNNSNYINNFVFQHERSIFQMVKLS